jgi:hypothetical protein
LPTLTLALAFLSSLSIGLKKKKKKPLILTFRNLKLFSLDDLKDSGQQTHSRVFFGLGFPLKGEQPFNGVGWGG